MPLNARTSGLDVDVPVMKPVSVCTGSGMVAEATLAATRTQANASNGRRFMSDPRP
jgi:hypothetical protein